jgi:31-O-methyltransferase
MSSYPERTAHRSFRLPDGLDVDSLSDNDTLMVYRDIFEDDCYRRCGVTILDGDCILDVGANTGLFILYVNKILNNARIYAFEPVPATFQVLRRNVEMHNRLPIQLFNVGLSNHSGRATFTHYPRLSNASTLYPDDSARAARRGRDYVLEQFRMLPQPLAGLLSLCPAPMRDTLAEQVRRYYLKKQAVICELTTLSEFLGKNGIARVDLLKVDAEQSEQRILAGLAQEDWPKIRQVVVEVHGGDEAIRVMMESLRRRGFRTDVGPNPSFPTLSLVYGIRYGRR